MFGESRSIKPEEDKRPAGVWPRVSSRSRQTPTRISSKLFSSTTARMPGQLRRAPGKGSESNNLENLLAKIVEKEDPSGLIGAICH
jgi:hypothetical protein